MPMNAEMGLYCLGAATLIAYFTLFIKTLNSLPETERERLGAENPSQLSWLTVLPIVAVFFVEGLYIRLLLSVLCCAWAVWASIRHYARLQQQGFDPHFVARLKRVDVLSGVGMVLLCGGAIAGA